MAKSDYPQITQITQKRRLEAGGRPQVAGAGCRWQEQDAGDRRQAAGGRSRPQVAGAGRRWQEQGAQHPPRGAISLTPWLQPGD